MADYPVSLVLEAFSSAFVDETLFAERLGGSKTDPQIIERYLSLPIASRPEVSFFFDREFYWQRYPDIQRVDIDPLVHFIKWGVAEKRAPHPLIDLDHITAARPDLLPDPPTIDALHDALSHDLIDPSPLFSLAHYQSQLDGSETLEGGLLRNFLQTGILRGLRPKPSFDPVAYYQSVDGKTFDLRSSLRLYARSAKTREAVSTPVTEPQAKALFRTKAAATQLLRGQHPLQFALTGPADLSVIMVAHDNFALTLQSLASLRANYPGPIELILIDSGSGDETRHLSQYVTGAHLLRFDTNVSFVRGCNAGLEVATADAILFLNNDIELAPGAIAQALRRLHADPKTGAVGAKVIRTNGLLQEAGCILWRDGWTVGYLRDQSPLVPEANFVRDVDGCSAVFLLARTTVLRNLRGFDVAFAPAYFEDSDLCLRIRDAGYRIVYDPAVVVHHLEYGSSPDSAAVHQRIHQAHDVFFEKHRNRLRVNYASNVQASLFARAVNQPTGRVLLIEDQLPLRRLGSGFVRSNDIVGIMAGLGYHVTVYPIHPNRHDLASVYADFPDTVEVIHDRSLQDLSQFITDRRGYYNTIWIARAHNLDLVKPILEQAGPDVLGAVRLVLDTEAIGAAREAQRHGLQHPPEAFDTTQALRQELRNAPFCQTIVAVNAPEAAQIQALGFTNVKVVGHIRPLALTPRTWAQRAGMLFVGALHSIDSPNYDSLCWFVDQVLPLIERELGYETRLTIAGHLADDVDLERFRDHPRITLRGPIADMVPLYDAHRVFVAPTRYAAGIPYKIHEAASHGLPVVATEVLRRQLGWDHGRELFAADASDAAAFARQILALYRSEALWTHVRVGAAERIRAECGCGACERVVEKILQ